MTIELWFAKSLLATLSIVPAFIAIPVFKSKFGIDPLVFLVWYFSGTAICTAVFWALSGKASTLAPSVTMVAAIFAIGVLFGSLANGLLFQAVGLAPNPGLPPVIYATSSMLVFVLSFVLANSFPSWFRPVSADLGRLAGIVLVLAGLYLLAGGKVGNPLRWL